jgi:hypothetical protein
MVSNDHHVIPACGTPCNAHSGGARFGPCFYKAGLSLILRTRDDLYETGRNLFFQWGREAGGNEAAPKLFQDRSRDRFMRIT